MGDKHRPPIHSPLLRRLASVGGMFIHMSIHVPNPGHEQEVLDSMNRVRLAALGTRVSS